MSARKAGEVDYGGCSQEQLLHFLRLRDRQATTSRQFWVRAAKAALGGDDRELHNRVELAEAGPVTITNGDTEYTFAAPATDEAAAEIDALRTRAETAESSLASTLASVDGMREALGLIADIAEGSGTANSLPHIAKIAREATSVPTPLPVAFITCNSDAPRYWVEIKTETLANAQRWHNAVLGLARMGQ